MATFDQLLAQRDTILAMAAARGAEAVRVFGSVARGDGRGELLLYHARELIHRFQAYTEPGCEACLSGPKTEKAAPLTLAAPSRQLGFTPFP